MLLKFIGYRKKFDKTKYTKYMSFLIKNDKLLEKYSKIGDKVSTTIKKGSIVNQYTMKNI